MLSNTIQNKLIDLIDVFNFNGYKNYKLIIFFGLLGDFDTLEYAINLRKFIDNNQNEDLDIFAIAIGSENGKEKFCKFTGFPKENLKVVSNNKIHNNLKISKGIDIGLGGWVNMLLMLSGINSFKTIQEVIRGYTGDHNAKQIFSDSDQIKITNIAKFSGISFKNAFGEGYLRPFELATFRLNNMIEIFKNWGDYMINTKYLPQRSCTFILDQNNNVIYKYFSKDILNYSKNMKAPLDFLNQYI